MKKLLKKSHVRFLGKPSQLKEFGFTLSSPDQETNIIAISDHLLARKVRGKIVLDWKESQKESLYDFLKSDSLQISDPSLLKLKDSNLQLLVQGLNEKKQSTHKHVLILQDSKYMFSTRPDVIRESLIKVLRSQRIDFEKNPFLIRTANTSFHFYYVRSQNFKKYRKMTFDSIYDYVSDVGSQKKAIERLVKESKTNSTKVHDLNFDWNHTSAFYGIDCELSALQKVSEIVSIEPLVRTIKYYSVSDVMARLSDVSKPIETLTPDSIAGHSLPSLLADKFYKRSSYFMLYKNFSEVKAIALNSMKNDIFSWKSRSEELDKEFTQNELEMERLLNRQKQLKEQKERIEIHQNHYLNLLPYLI